MSWCRPWRACRARDGAIPTRRRNRCAGRYAPRSTSSGARSHCATFTFWRCEIKGKRGSAMLGRLNHVAIAVKDAEKAARIYGTAFGADISAAVPLPEHGVITVFATLPNTKIEFIQPLGETSPIAKFLERNADGGIHHVCYDVPDIIAARDTLIKEGARVLGDGVPKIGAHGKPVLFLHPKDFSGALVEIEQE